MAESAAVTLDVQNYPQLHATFQRLIRANHDLRVPLKRMGAHMHKSIKENFEAQGIPEVGVSWQPLSPVTIKRRRKGKGTGNPQILQDRGHMRMSVVSKTGPGTIFRLGKDFLAIGTNLDYATDHQPLNGAAKTVKPAHYVPNVKVREHKRKRRKGRGKIKVRAHTRNQFVAEQTIPARPFLAFKPSDADRCGNILLDWEVEQIRKGWPS